MIKNIVKLFVVCAFVFSFTVQLAVAAKPDHAGGSKPGGGGKPDNGGETSLIGYDVSWPQCDRSLPGDHAFGIVGVNGGLATTFNPCLDEQLIWASNASGAIEGQDKVQLYVNTANPGQVLKQYSVTSWPVDNTDPNGFSTLADGTNPHGECKTKEGAYGGYDNSLACSWQYGWDRAVNDVDYFAETANSVGLDSDPSNYIWWLDVETENSWQTGGSVDLAKNTATLEGMTAYFTKIGARVGIYSTSYQWGVITGNTVSNGSNLNGLESWLAGARNSKDAAKKCSDPALTANGHVSLVQFVSKNLDHNVACV